MSHRWDLIGAAAAAGLVVLLCMSEQTARAQTTRPQDLREGELRERVDRLEERVRELTRELQRLRDQRWRELVPPGSPMPSRPWDLRPWDLRPIPPGLRPTPPEPRAPYRYRFGPAVPPNPSEPRLPQPFEPQPPQPFAPMQPMPFAPMRPQMPRGIVPREFNGAPLYLIPCAPGARGVD